MEAGVAAQIEVGVGVQFQAHGPDLALDVAVSIQGEGLYLPAFGVAEQARVESEATVPSISNFSFAAEAEAAHPVDGQVGGGAGLEDLALGPGQPGASAPNVAAFEAGSELIAQIALAACKRLAVGLAKAQ